MDYKIEEAMVIIAQLEYERRVQNARANMVINAQQEQIEQQQGRIVELSERLGLEPDKTESGEEVSDGDSC